MRYLGIDYGTKRTGIALSDEAGTMGFPHSALSTDNMLLGEIVAIIKKEKVDAIVIGESLDFSGKENPVAAQAHALGDALSIETDLPVAYEIEMLTTQEARRQPDGTRPSWDVPVDSAAAALILTSYLSRPHD